MYIIRYTIWALVIAFQKPQPVCLVRKRIIYHVIMWSVKKILKTKMKYFSGNPLGSLMESYNLSWLSSSSMAHVWFNMNSKPWFATMNSLQTLCLCYTIYILVYQFWTCIHIQIVNNFLAVSTLLMVPPLRSETTYQIF